MSIERLFSNPALTPFEKLRDLMIANGAKWPPDPPSVASANVSQGHASRVASIGGKVSVTLAGTAYEKSTAIQEMNGYENQN